MLLLLLLICQGVGRGALHRVSCSPYSIFCQPSLDIWEYPRSKVLQRDSWHLGKEVVSLEMERVSNHEPRPSEEEALSSPLRPTWLPIFHVQSEWKTSNSHKGHSKVKILRSDMQKSFTRISQTIWYQRSATIFQFSFHCSFKGCAQFSSLYCNLKPCNWWGRTAIRIHYNKTDLMCNTESKMEHAIWKRIKNWAV